ncbi:DUF5988 family protein [Amycolatopsis sp. NPDC049868]|uniref:DUF5988 family protein n=1 Tax=Amycolatopsis sp. NPDC049868 TaxID=3363934 RepID=UPI00378E3CBB
MARIRINLVGSPSRLTPLGDGHYVDDLTEDVKICVDGGYEHFSHRGEFEQVDEARVAVYHWTGRTKIAE